MYILTLKNVQLNLDANSYIEVRKLIDIGMNNTFRYAFYVALLTNITLFILTLKTPSSILFITTLIALVALVIDTLFALKGSLPINELINSWTIDKYPTNWTEYRTKWFTIFQYRQLANIIGFVSLLIGVVFQSK